VNPEAASRLSYTFPPGNWSNIDGGPLSGSVELGPTSAAVILAR